MNNSVQAPILKKKNNLSPIWLLPILAAILGLWLLVSYIQERGQDITVKFPSANGIEANKTFVRYQGIIVGQVTKVRLAKDKISVDVSIRMQNSVDDLLRAETQFWLVSPKASLTGIDGLDALVSGNYIAMAPGSGKPKHRFTGAAKAPPLTEHKEGLLIRISAPQRGSLDIGSGIYFQQVKVGEVVDFKLQQDGSGVVFDAFVEPEYQFLVRQNSRFWNISGAKAVLNRSQFKVQLNSLATLLAGGISFSSPKQAEAAIDEQLFELYSDQEEANPRVAISFIAADADGLAEGTAIRYRGIDIGQIDKIELADDDVSLTGWVEARYRHLLKEGTQFSRVGATLGLEKIAHLDTLIFGEFVRIWPGDGKVKTQFDLLDDAPITPSVGKRFTLTQQKLTGVAVGAPLRYRGVAVGEVLDIRLTANGVELDTLIAREHQHLVRKNSRFWVQSAVEVKADFSELKISAEPLMNVISGGIAFTSSEKVDEASSGSTFALAKSRSAAMEPAPATFTLIADSLSGLNVGAPILYRDLETGKITNIKLTDGNQLKVSVEIEHKYRYLINENTRFWHYSGIEVEGSLGGISIRSNPLVSMIRGGISFGHLSDNVTDQPLNDKQIYQSERQALANNHLVTLTLAADGNIDTNAPVRYLGHQIGLVRSVELSTDLSKQIIIAELHQPWASQFVRSDTVYYLVQPKVSLAGIRHVETILEGNHIAALPGKNEDSLQQFNVATEEPLQTAYGEGLRLVLNQSRLGSLHIGSPVLYRQIRVGEVIHTRLTANSDSVDIEIQLKPQYQHLVNTTSRFWNASGVDIDFGVFSGADIKTESFETLLAGGIAFATQKPTSADNKLPPNAVVKLYTEVKPSWLEWKPKL